MISSTVIFGWKDERTSLIFSFRLSEPISPRLTNYTFFTPNRFKASTVAAGIELVPAYNNGMFL